MVEVLKSVHLFIQGSIVSLIVILIIYLLLTRLEQAFVMVVDLTESSTWSIILTYFLLFGLALSLSHYPIYTYYAGNVNRSRKHFAWFVDHPFKWLPFINVRYFRKKEVKVRNKLEIDIALEDEFELEIKAGQSPSEAERYKKNTLASILRYSIGFVVFYAWLVITIKSYEPKLQFVMSSTALTAIKWTLHVLMLILWIFYIRMKILWLRDKEDHFKMIKRLRVSGIIFIIAVTLSFSILAYLAFCHPFSVFGFLMNFVLIFTTTASYFLFRMLRSDLIPIPKDQQPVLMRPLFKMLAFLHDSKQYLVTMMLVALFSFAIIAISNIQAVMGYEMLNGVPIVLAYLYFYSYLLHTLSKYFFVAHLEFTDETSGKTFVLKETSGYRIRVYSIVGIVVLLIVSGIWDEQNTHVLQTVERQNSNEMSIATFEEPYINKDTLFFIASHGGGLKANAWTLQVLNELQCQTNGKLLENTIAVSGASGGSLGLSLYLAMYGEDGKDHITIQDKIETIISGNYTSLDLTFLFGSDMVRGLWPLRQIAGKNRTYYSMLSYQNSVKGEAVKDDRTPFRSYWKNIYHSTHNKEVGAPSLIMNTAGIDGRRGILWSVDQDHKTDFCELFHYSVDLAELQNNQTLSYYDATSMTNRFPLFSPSAKVKNYGHFIDAGAIDNSGLLGCLDVLKYLTFKRPRLKMDQKCIVFIEIYNSKSLYIKYLLEQYIAEYGQLHWVDNEDEQSTLSNDLSAGTNLDKFPGYLEGMMHWMREEFKDRIEFIRIPLPYKITIADVEEELKGTIYETHRPKLKKHLEEWNKKVDKALPEANGFFDKWNYYAPVLSRYYDEGSRNYNRDIIGHPDIQRQIQKIYDLSGIN